MNNAILRSLNINKHTKTRIMATVGPSSMKYEDLKRMVENGVNFFRFNGAHIVEQNPGKGELSYEQANTIVEHIRHLRNEFRQLIGIYFDLGGPKIRVLQVLSVQRSGHKNEVKDNWLQPRKDEIVTIYPRSEEKEKEFETKHKEFEEKSEGLDWTDQSSIKEFFNYIGKTDGYEIMLGGDVEKVTDFAQENPIHLKDGWCKLKILNSENEKLTCKVEYVDSKFEFRPGQGANPFRHIFKYIITKKDENDIERALRMGADIISLSFVCSPLDADNLREIINAKKETILKDESFLATQSELYQRYISKEHEIPIFAKIETAFAVLQEEARRYAKEQEIEVPINKDWNPLLEIAERFNGLMVARGDLAVEVEKYKVPELQRQIIEIAHLKNKPVIVATEMLESMKRGDASTRAEISDINTAVHQEADILMLSGETANIDGDPAKPVEEMQKAIKQAEEERSV
ncbi:MAG: pyruvate kinase, partial [Blastocatellia bacterium]|nr:pyruvate kinase [Blastocatellia bacterium]